MCWHLQNQMVILRSVLEVKFTQYCTCAAGNPWGTSPGMDRVLFHIHVRTHFAKGIFREILLVETASFLKSKTLKILETACAEKIDDPFHTFENLEYGINVFQKSWNENLVLWDQQLPKTLNDRWIFETSSKCFRC